MPRVAVRGISQRRAQTSTRAADEKLLLQKLTHFSGQPALLSGRPDSRALPGHFPDGHCREGPAGRAQHSTAPSTGAARTSPQWRCRAQCSYPQIPGECDPRAMAILGSHRHSGNNLMSGPDMSSREKKHSSVWPRRGKGARCSIWEPAALVPCPAWGEQLEGAHGGTAGARGHAGSSWTGHEFLPAAGPAGHSNGSRGRNGKQREL